MDRMNGRVAVVTGGASGLGEATVRVFVEEGAKVVVADLNDARGEALASELRGGGAEVEYRRTDVRSSEQIADTVGFAEDRFGHLDTMVANAGITGSASRKTLDEVEDDEWNAVIDTNLGGVWRAFKYGAAAIRRAGGGTMTSTGSMSGTSVMGGARLGTYTASKFAITGLTAYFASELVDDGIRVNCVCPGRMITNIDESFGFTASQLIKARADRRKTESATHRRFIADPREVAMLHLFLSSDESSFITGQAIDANGGESLFLALDWTSRGQG